MTLVTHQTQRLPSIHALWISSLLAIWVSSHLLRSWISSRRALNVSFSSSLAMDRIEIYHHDSHHVIPPWLPYTTVDSHRVRRLLPASYLISHFNLQTHAQHRPVEFILLQIGPTPTYKDMHTSLSNILPQKRDKEMFESLNSTYTYPRNPRFSNPKRQVSVRDKEPTGSDALLIVVGSLLHAVLSIAITASLRSRSLQ